MFACVGSPLVGSMPHFLYGDPSLLENIASGLNPDKDKHIIYMDMETVIMNVSRKRNVNEFDARFQELLCRAPNVCKSILRCSLSRR